MSNLSKALFGQNRNTDAKFQYPLVEVGYRILPLFSSHVKGISSIKLHDDLGLEQKTAWHMGHRIREAWNGEMEKFSTTVEFDEAFIGGLERYRHRHKKYNLGRGFLGKAVLGGAKDRGTGKFKLEVLPDTRTETMHKFVRNTVTKMP